MEGILRKSIGLTKQISLISPRTYEDDRQSIDHTTQQQLSRLNLNVKSWHYGSLDQLAKWDDLSLHEITFMPKKIMN